MMVSRLRKALLVAITVAFLFGDRALASSHIWITIGPPNPSVIPNAIFKTNLVVSSWNGNMGAFDLLIRYDPSVVRIVDFSTSVDSEFHMNCSVDSASFNSGKTRIACFQVMNRVVQDRSKVVGVLTWKVIGVLGSETDISIEPSLVVDANWRSVEVLTYGQHLTVEMPRIYMPLILRSH